MTEKQGFIWIFQIFLAISFLEISRKIFFLEVVIFCLFMISSSLEVFLDGLPQFKNSFIYRFRYRHELHSSNSFAQWHDAKHGEFQVGWKLFIIILLSMPSTRSVNPHFGGRSFMDWNVCNTKLSIKTPKCPSFSELLIHFTYKDSKALSHSATPFPIIRLSPLPRFGKVVVPV